jgi:hypothetical protein
MSVTKAYMRAEYITFLVRKQKRKKSKKRAPTT